MGGRYFTKILMAAEVDSLIRACSMSPVMVGQICFHLLVESVIVHQQPGFNHSECPSLSCDNCNDDGSSSVRKALSVIMHCEPSW